LPRFGGFSPALKFMDRESPTVRSPIVITGSEGSGTNFVGRVLSASPDVGGSLAEWTPGTPFVRGVYHVSVPHGRGMSTYWPRAKDFDGCRVIVARRGLLDSTYSAYRRFYKPGMAHLALRHQFEALEVLSEIRARHAANLEEIEYESLGSRAAIRSLLAALDLGVGMEREEAFTSQNGAYLKDQAFLRGIRRRAWFGRLGSLTLGRIRSKDLASRRTAREDVPPPVSIGAAGGLRSTLAESKDLALRDSSNESS
jgi:hypothetical protein